MMTSTEWTSRFLFTIGVFITASSLINLLIDPYGVFETAIIKPGPFLNERYVKLKQLLDKQVTVSTLIVGSSTAGLCDPEDVPTEVGRAYNLSFLGGTPREIELTLRALDNNGKLPRRIIMPIDLFQFVEHRSLSDNPTRWMPPAITGESEWSFLLRYLVTPAWMHAILTIQNRLQDAPDFDQDLNRGNYRLPAKDVGNKTVDVKLTGQIRLPINPQSEAEYRQLVRWLDSKHVQLTVWLNPVHPTLQTHLAPTDTKVLLDRIRQITPTLEDHLLDPLPASAFYDKFHYRPFVCRSLLTRPRLATTSSTWRL